jgi:hypothetical protein
MNAAQEAILNTIDRVDSQFKEWRASIIRIWGVAALSPAILAGELGTCSVTTYVSQWNHYAHGHRSSSGDCHDGIAGAYDAQRTVKPEL